ncbi:SH3 domain-containing protein [Christensenellaceae bacterium OttesenSCG-928-L17]|nr:SH3 domain-containing protein [Christensenellaceae bacterium OttesenSCG-928-L17]
MKKFLSCLLLLTIALSSVLSAAPALAAVPSGYTSKIDYENNDPNKYKIEIDLTNQVITVYAKDATGAFANIVLQGLCTTGNDENPTGAGTYKLGHLKERFGYFVAFGQYAQYWTQVVRGIYIHSVMYDSKSLTDMSKSAYNNLGKALSHGCVRVLPEHAQWIFYNCPPGTVCQIKKGTKNTALVSKLKAAKPSYSNYRQPVDHKADPPVVKAAAWSGNVPVRTGFSSSKDKTVYTLSAGENVTLLQIGPDWCKVETKAGKLGYVKTQYLLFDPDSTVSSHGAYYASAATYLYQSPSTSAATLHTYAPGDEIEVVGTADKYWLTARAGKQYGYVRVKYTQSVKPETAPVVLDTGEINASIRTGIIANMRSGPGTEYEVVAELKGDTDVRLTGVTGNWYSAVVNGKQGYLHKVCISYG